jgi:hypothetical protein
MFYLLDSTAPYMLGLIGSPPKGRPIYFKGRDPTPHPKIQANPYTLSTFPTGINSVLAKFIIKPDTASNNKNKLHKLLG